MEILKPEAMRATRAHKAFKSCSRALRKTDTDDLYAESFTSERLSCFWSHSWHGRLWMKILTLMMRYNGLPSVLSGSFTALVMAVLVGCGLLPRIHSSWAEWSMWSLGSGFAAAVLTFCFWQPQQPVFLDRICINESNNDQKAACIFSLAGILKRSDEMLVLWDATWSDRLWCLFELAAFLKSKDASQQTLFIRPTFLGPCSIVMFIGSFFVMLPMTAIPQPKHLGEMLSEIKVLLMVLLVAILTWCLFIYFIVASLRAYFRSVETLKKKLQNICLDDTRCSCCDLGHVQEGTPMLCDRRIVNECVSIWFGSQEAFENYVRSAVLETVVSGLEETIFTRGWSLSVASPMIWCFFDWTASYAAGGHRKMAIAHLIEGLVLWLICGPFFTDLWLFFSCRYCRRRASTFLEAVANLKVGLLAVAYGCAVICSWILLCFTRPVNERLSGAGAFAGVWGTLALSQFAYKCFKKANKRLGHRDRFTVYK